MAHGFAAELQATSSFAQAMLSVQDAHRDLIQAHLEELKLYRDAPSTPRQGSWPHGPLSQPAADTIPNEPTREPTDFTFTSRNVLSLPPEPSSASSPCASPSENTKRPAGTLTADIAASILMDDSAPSSPSREGVPEDFARQSKPASERGSTITSSKLRFAAKEQDPTGPLLKRMVMHKAFDLFFLFLILLNTIVLAVEAQYHGMILGSQLGYERYPVGVVWPGADIFFEHAEYIFGAIFTLELTIRLMAFHWRFFGEFWNWLDLCIVLGFFVTTLMNISVVSPMAMRMARLVRQLRLLKLVRRMKGLESLYVMTVAIKHSLFFMVWAVLVLLLLQMVCAFLLQVAVAPYMQDHANPDDDKNLVFMYYGTFTRCLLTMFEITLGNWMPPCRALVENISEAYMIPIVTHKIVIGFALLAVINGVFIQETFKVANADDHVMMLQKERAVKVHTRKMHALFAHLDDDGDGALSFTEFRGMLDEDAVRTWLSAMELDISDVAQLFELLDSGAVGKLTAEQLCVGVSKLKGGARSMETHTILQDVRRLCHIVGDVQKGMAEMKQGAHISPKDERR